MNTGLVDFGTPASTHHAHFLKDFEFELMVLSRLVATGTIPTLFPEANDPRGDAISGSLYIECKHPNSVKQLKKLIAAFAKSLKDESRFGVFAVALEDCFKLGDVASFPTESVYRLWLENKRDEMEVFGKQLAAYAARFEPIVGFDLHTDQAPCRGSEHEAGAIGEFNSLRRAHNARGLRVGGLERSHSVQP
jgi:hypothetical protein